MTRAWRALKAMNTDFQGSQDTCIKSCAQKHDPQGHLSNGNHTWWRSKRSSSRCARCRRLAARTSTSLRFMRPVSRPNSSSSAGPEAPASADSASAAAVSAAAPAAAPPLQHCQLPTSKNGTTWLSSGTGSVGVQNIELARVVSGCKSIVLVFDPKMDAPGRRPGHRHVGRRRSD